MHRIKTLVLSGCAWAVCLRPVLAEQPVVVSVASPRRAFYRGEEILLLVDCANSPDAPALGAGTMHASIGGYERASATIKDLPPGQRTIKSFRLPTAALKPGDYDLAVRLTVPGHVETRVTERIAIGRRPNPHRLMVWLWGGGGGRWYIDHGFTTWTGPAGRAVDATFTDKNRRALDQALLAGASVGIFPNGGLVDIDPTSIGSPDAQYIGVRSAAGKPLANPFHPEVARRQDNANRNLMEFVRDYPQVQTAFFNTEVVDSLGANRNEAGKRRMRETLGFAEDEIGAARFVAPGVIADDDRKYLLHKYLYKRGNGLALANKRTADMIHRYRPDILTFTDPHRETTLLDILPSVDVVGSWTYTNPDPKLMLYVETLRAACKPTGQRYVHTVTLLNYPGELAPTDEWMLMGPGRAKVTSWINLSRAPKILGYYYSSACVPVDTDTARVPYSTSAAIRELAENVFKPYGPMITRLEVAPRRIAVLSSAAARVHGNSPRLRGSYANLQIYHFYSVMAMAHLQADVVFDETIERFGLDGYNVLVLPKCDVLPKSVYDHVRRFRARGGIVVADQYLGPEIPGAITFDFDFTYRDKVSAKAIAKNEMYAQWNDHLQPNTAAIKTVEGITALDDQRIMEAFAARLKSRLAGVVEPAVDCDEPTVLFNLLENNGAKYLVVINDKRTYDDRVGRFKGVLGQLQPQTVVVRLHEWQHSGLHIYDMLQRKALAVTRHDGGHQFTVALTQLGGTVLAMYPLELAHLDVLAAGRMTIGVPAGVTVSLTDPAGNPVRGLQPVEVRFTDPEGAVSTCSDYYCAEDGTLHVEFISALNDKRGRWIVTVRDLTAGLATQAAFEVTD